MKTPEEWAIHYNGNVGQGSLLAADFRQAQREAALDMRTRCAEALSNVRVGLAAAIVLAVPLPGDPTP